MDLHHILARFKYNIKICIINIDYHVDRKRFSLILFFFILYFIVPIHLR